MALCLPGDGGTPARLEDPELLGVPGPACRALARRDMPEIS